MHGDTYGGHIYYMIKELLNNSKLNFKIYVSLKDTEDIELLFDKSELKRINFVKHMSNQYYELMATCEYLINDTTFYPFFNKREGQKYYIIWHGTPLKHMGKDIPKVVDIANVQRNFYMADRIYVNNQKTMEILARTHHLNNVYNGKFIVGPSPRNSVFFEEEKRNQNRNDFNLNNKKMLAYMPTWRGNIGSVQNSQHVTKLITYFEENLDENTVLYVKLHPFEKTIIPDSYEKVKPFPSNIETYEFLAVTDCLITDYSSVMYDYVNLGKPVILYTYDYKDYKENRGLYDDLSLYPFIQSNSLEGLLKQVEQIPQQIDYQEFKNEYNKYDKIDAPKIIINHMFLDKDDLTIEEHNLHNGKETVVIVSGGFWSNGITTALINTLENIDTTEKNYICFFEKDKVKKNIIIAC
ncbi:CDP-glycerol glycerophosphotransferase family protein [Mammaliicoccus sciuri]|nr:CDP-glycerol glycerophosphotransferase family protein [Mammaliicoccus sciuri]